MFLDAMFGSAVLKRCFVDAQSASETLLWKLTVVGKGSGKLLGLFTVLRGLAHICARPPDGLAIQLDIMKIGP